jgi:hypothetical protein
MSRAAWDALDADCKRVRGGHRYVVDPATGGDPVRVRLRELADARAASETAMRRPTVAEVAALLSALTRELS